MMHRHHRSEEEGVSWWSRACACYILEVLSLGAEVDSPAGLDCDGANSEPSDLVGVLSFRLAMMIWGKRCFFIPLLDFACIDGGS